MREKEACVFLPISSLVKKCSSAIPKTGRKPRVIYLIKIHRRSKQSHIGPKHKLKSKL